MQTCLQKSKQTFKSLTCPLFNKEEWPSLRCGGKDWRLAQKKRKKKEKKKVNCEAY